MIPPRWKPSSSSFPFFFFFCVDSRDSRLTRDGRRKNLTRCQRGVRSKRCGIGSDVLLRINLRDRDLSSRYLSVTRKLNKFSCDLISFLENRVNRVLKTYKCIYVFEGLTRNDSDNILISSATVLTVPQPGLTFRGEKVEEFCCKGGERGRRTSRWNWKRLGLLWTVGVTRVAQKRTARQTFTDCFISEAVSGQPGALGRKKERDRLVGWLGHWIACTGHANCPPFNSRLWITIAISSWAW